jgi:hypothetical protein
LTLSESFTAIRNKKNMNKKLVVFRNGGAEQGKSEQDSGSGMG